MTPLLVATDLDGCLLDEATQSFAGAEEALKALREENAALILCSSKTRAEVEPLAAELGFRCPFIVENGGALVIPAGSWPEARGTPGGEGVLVFGVRRTVLVKELAKLAARTRVRVKSFSSLSPRALKRLTGLSGAGARRARRRQYDEPFLVAASSTKKLRALKRAAEERGLRVTRGGRFFHLTGQADKGRALEWLLGLYPERRLHTLGLGNCENDVSLLSQVERPILIPRSPGRVDPTLKARFPKAEVAPEPGPKGWASGILRVLRGGKLPKVSEASRRRRG